MCDLREREKARGDESRQVDWLLVGSREGSREREREEFVICSEERGMSASLFADFGAYYWFAFLARFVFLKMYNVDIVII